MPTVTMQTVTIPATFVCSTVKKPSDRSIEIVDRLRCESVVEAAVRMACYSERLSGFVAICMALHHESRFVLPSQEKVGNELNAFEARCLNAWICIGIKKNVSPTGVHSA